MDKKQHWENVYLTKNSNEVSWYEANPNQSLELILKVTGEERPSLIDVGGGQSLLVDRLLDRGFEQVAVLDLSPTAIDATKARLGARADKVQWITADITKIESLGHFSIWHDRAVLHFLTEPDARLKYVSLLKKTLPSGGYFIVGAFAKGGPEKCSGLPVQQYDEQTMQELLGSDFEQVHSCNYVHTTPASKLQQFYFGVFRRR